MPNDEQIWRIFTIGDYAIQKLQSEIEAILNVGKFSPNVVELFENCPLSNSGQSFLR